MHRASAGPAAALPRVQTALPPRRRSAAWRANFAAVAALLLGTALAGRADEEAPAPPAVPAEGDPTSPAEPQRTAEAAKPKGPTEGAGTPAAETPAKETPAKETPAKEKPAKPAKEDDKTVVAERGAFKVVVDLSGALEPEAASEVMYEPEVYGGELKVVEAFRGGPVEEGQVLVRFSTEKLDEQLEAMARDVEIARRALARQQEEAKKAAEASDAALARATLDRERAEKSQRRFLETDRDIRVKEAELRLKAAEDSIKDQEEELAQLRRMYGAGDAVEETERIVLERAQRQLDRSRISLEFQRNRHRWFMDVDLPDEARALELGVRREVLSHERVHATAAVALEQSRLELARAEAAFRKQEKALLDLRRDREALVLKAPRAGLAVPGACVRGKWQGVEETQKELVVGGKLRAKTPLFTIVTPGAVVVRTSVPEAKVLSVRPGMKAEVRPAADDRARLAGRVRSVAAVASDGGFPVVLEFVDRDARLLPGFTVKAKVTVRDETDVLSVPAKAVGGEGDERKVFVVTEGEEAPTPRVVRLGDTAGDRVEVLEGLEPGERLLATPPK